MSQPRTRASNKRRASAVNTDDPAVSSNISAGSSSQSKLKAAVTSLDDDETDAVVTHRYGTIPHDMQIAMGDFPEHVFCVHKAVMALHSKDFFTTVINQLDDDSDTVHLPANSGSSWSALDFLLQMIYDDNKQVVLTSSNHYFQAGDEIFPDGMNYEATVECVNGGYKEKDDVHIMHRVPCYETDHEHGHGGFTSKTDYKNQYAYVFNQIREMKPRTPLPHLNTVTSIEQILPLTAYLNSTYVLHHLEEHLIHTAYFADDKRRVQLLALADQYKLFRAFTSLVGFCDVPVIRTMMKVKGSSKAFSKAALEVLVDRLTSATTTSQSDSSEE